MLPDSAPETANPWGDAPSPYEELGGETVLRVLVDRFYDRIAADSPALRAMHPADDSNSRRTLFEFLSGWMGVPCVPCRAAVRPSIR